MRDRAKLPGWPAAMRAELAAAYLDVSVGTLRTLVEAGRLPPPTALTVGCKIWRRRDLDRLLDLEGATSNDTVTSIEDAIDEWDRACNADGAGGSALPSRL
jgi:hypothetical protein